MKMLTVRLPETLVADIEEESRTRRISRSDVVRERLQHASRDVGAQIRSRSSRGSSVRSAVFPPISARGRSATSGRADMERSVLVDAGFVTALLSGRDRHHEWAKREGAHHAPPWRTCEAVLSEAFSRLGRAGRPALSVLLGRGLLIPAFDLATKLHLVLRLVGKYAGVPMSLADACLVRMTETVADPVLLTTDADFRVYRRHSRQVVPAILP